MKQLGPTRLKHVAARFGIFAYNFETAVIVDSIDDDLKPAHPSKYPRARVVRM